MTKKEKEILELLKTPKTSGDLITGLGYDPTNFVLTEQIGDNQGDWQQSKHKLILADLIEDEKVSWGYDKEDNVWYYTGKKPKQVLSQEEHDKRKGKELQLARLIYDEPGYENEEGFGIIPKQELNVLPKPCPKCGSEKVHVIEMWDAAVGSCWSAFVGCQDCKHKGEETSWSNDKAVVFWNLTEEQRKRRDFLNKKLDKLEAELNKKKREIIAELSKILEEK
ncbi:MAG: hypothetical protein ACTSSK_03555 [Candidatus Heimdallarchaeota archaeon]